MAVYLISSIERYIGLSSDIKPTPEFYGSTFFETDTRLTYICYDGVNWTQYVDEGGSGSGAMATSTNPAASAAVTVAIVDAYAGVIILQNDGTPANQTLASPTITTPGKVFTVVNNDTSVENETVIANSVSFTITPGEAQSFIWDGSAWGPTDIGITAIPVIPLQGGTGLTTITDHGIMLGSGTSAVTPMAVLDTGQMVVGVTGADPTTVAAQIVASRKFLHQTGTGAAGATPTWEALTSGDLTTPLTTPPPIGGTTPAPVYASPTISKGPAIITTFAGTVSTSGSSTTIVFTSSADAILAGYSTATPTLSALGTTLITAAAPQASVTKHITSWNSSTSCEVDSACTLADGTAIASVQLPIVTLVASDGTVAGWVLANKNVYFIGKQVIGTTEISANSKLDILSTAVNGTRIVNIQGNGPYISFINTNDGYKWSIGQSVAAVDDGRFTIYDDQSGAVLVLDKDGNVMTGGLSAAGTSAAKWEAMGSGTMPTAIIADAAQRGVQDYNGVAGDARYHFIGEASAARKSALGSGTVSIKGAAASGGGFTRQLAEAVSTALSGATGSIAVNVPSGARILGVQLRVDTEITSSDGGTSWTAAYVNVPTTAICATQALDKSTRFNAVHPAYELSTGTVTIALTMNAGKLFSAGVVRGIVYFEAIDQMIAAP